VKSKGIEQRAWSIEHRVEKWNDGMMEWWEGKTEDRGWALRGLRLEAGTFGELRVNSKGNGGRQRAGGNLSGIEHGASFDKLRTSRA
jgi:hypothetical protein